MDNKNFEIGQRVKQIRTELGLSQEAFGKKLGVTGTAISRIESGDRKLTGPMEIAICREFNISAIWLYEGLGESRAILTVGNELASYMGSLMADDNPKKQQLALVLLRLMDEDWELIEMLIKKAKKYINTNFD